MKLQQRKRGRLLLFLLVFLWTGFGFPASRAAAASAVEQVQLKEAKAGSTQITLSWKSVKGAVSYVIFRKGGGSDRYKKLAVQKAGEGTSYTDKNVKKGRSYTYTVKAQVRVSGKLKTGSADLKGVTAMVRIPEVVLESAVVDDNSITVHWKQLTDVSGYRIFRKKDKGAFQVLEENLPSTRSSYTDSTAGMGHLYTYTVCALVKNGSSWIQGKWDEAGVSARRTIQQPVLTAKAASGRVFLSWTSADGAEGFQVCRRLAGSAENAWVSLGKADRTARTFWDNTAVPGKTYVYSVRAFIRIKKKKHFSAYAEGRTVTCLPAAAVITRYTEGTEEDVLQWQAVSGADGYLIYRKPAGGAWKKIGEASANQTTYRMPSCPDGTSLAVRAWVRSGKKTLKSARCFPVMAGSGRYTQQRVLFIGDSLTWGYGWAGERMAVPYPARVSQVTGITALNRGISGITLARNESGFGSVIQRLTGKKDNYRNCSLIVLEIGTNDYGRNTPLGNASDQTEYTFCGALNQWFKNVKEYNPSAKILVVLPLYRQRFGKSLSIDPWKEKNECGATLTQYSKALKQAAIRNGAAVLDPMEAGVMKEEELSLLCDGLHLTEEGYLALGDALAAEVKKLLPVDSYPKEEED